MWLAHLWTHSLFFTFSELKLSKFDNVNHIEDSNNFSFQTQFLQFVQISSKQNPLKNQHLLHFSSRNCDVNSIKSDSSRAFQQIPRTPPNSNNFFQFWFSKNIIGKNGSIINSFHTIAPKSLKPSRCTLTHSELISSKTPIEHTAWSTVSWEISAWQIKTKHHASPPLLQP